MDHNQQNNQGLMQHFQSLISGLFPHPNHAAGQSERAPHNDTNAPVADSSHPPSYETVESIGTSPVNGSTSSNSSAAPVASSTPHEPPQPTLDYDSDASMPSLQTVSDASEEQDDQDVEMLTLPDSHPEPRSVEPSASTSTSTPASRPPSAARIQRRARVEDEEDEGDLRETNRQRMHSPVPPGEDDQHRFHPDMDAQQTSDLAPPLFHRVTYVVDMLPPGVRPGQPAPQGGPAVFFPFPTPAHTPMGAPAPQSATDNNNNTAPTDQNAPPILEAGAEGAPGAADFYAFLNTLRERFGNFTMPWGIFTEEEQDDPVRAKKLLNGLEEVPVGLVKRMERVGAEESEKPVCAVCFDDLLDPEAGGFHVEQEEQEAAPMEVEMDVQWSTPSPTTPEDEERKKLEKALAHKVVVLPCAHVFHASCLLPWFTRPHRTTCPTCRFDIDPESLTLTPPSARRTRRRQQPQAPPPAEPATTPAPTADGTPAAQTTPIPNPADANAGPQAGPQPRLHARRTIRPGDLPFGLVIDVSVFPGPMTPPPPPPPQAQQAQGPAIGTPLYNPVPPPPTPPPQPFFGPPPLPAAAGGAANANGSAPPRAFNPGMAGIGFIPAEFQLFFAPPGAHPPAATNNTNAQAPPPAPAAGPAPTAAQPQAEGPAPQTPPRGPHIHIHGDPGASALLADLLGLGRFQPQPPTGAPQQQQRQPLPSFQEFVNMSLPTHGPAQPHPPAEGATPQQQAAGTTPTPAGPEVEPPLNVNAMADTVARTLFQQIVFGAPPPFAGGPQPAHAPADNAHAPPVPPGPIPFTIPTQNQRPARQQPPEKKQWTPPPPPGATLRERVERKEREMGMRCSDISCGLAPTDEDPTPVVDPRAVRQIHLRPLPGKGDGAGKTQACEHAFHPACLVSAERVAGWSGADQKREVEGEEDVEVSCPVCRAVGCISRADWDEGACALA